MGGCGAVAVIPYISMVRFTTWRPSPSLRFTKSHWDMMTKKTRKTTRSPHRGSNLGLLSQNRRK